MTDSHDSETASILHARPGEVRLQLLARPVSLQGNPQGRQHIRELIRRAVSGVQVLFTHDTHITIEWIVHEWERYRSNQSPDLDNILKPILDALSGPHGVMINDCQVQAIAASWIDGPPYRPDFHQIDITVAGLADDCIASDTDIFFVEWPDRMCTILWRSLPDVFKLEILESTQSSNEAEQHLLEAGIAWDQARLVLVGGNRFHRSRLAGFEVVDANNLINRLRGF